MRGRQPRWGCQQGSQAAAVLPATCATTKPAGDAQQRARTGQALLVAGAVLRNVLGVALGQALNGRLNGLHAAVLAHRLGGVVGVGTGAVPAGGEEAPGGRGEQGRGVGERVGRPGAGSCCCCWVRRFGGARALGSKGARQQGAPATLPVRCSALLCWRLAAPSRPSPCRPPSPLPPALCTHQSPFMGLGAKVEMMPNSSPRRCSSQRAIMTCGEGRGWVGWVEG